MIEQHGEQFLTRVFTPREMHYARVIESRRSATPLCGRQGSRAEDAGSRVGQGTRVDGSGDLPQRERQGDGPVGGSIKEKADKKKVRDILVATAHCRSHATAYAIALKA